MKNPKKILDARETNIDYTRDQAKALVHIESFLSTNDKFYLLVGNAGTGKTTIAENIARYSNALILAPTNAAIKRLKDKFMSETIKDNRFKTIHQALYGTPDLDTGEFRISDNMESRCVYLIDEVSMIDLKVLKDLIVETTKKNSRIIFMGDDFQLEPIGYDPKIFQWEACPFMLEHHNERFQENWKFKLNEVKRSDGVILSVATHLRNNKGCQILNYNTPEFKVVPKFTEELPLDISHEKDFIVLVSTNKRRMKYNQHIRIAKFKEDAVHPVVDGERLISVANAQYLNGDIYTIRHPKIIDEFNVEINIGTQNDPNFKEYQFILLEHEVENSFNSFKTLLIPNLDKPSLHPTTLLSSQYIKNHPKLTKFTKSYYNKKKIWNNMVNISTYGYATSVHKSQGNEWDTVYIDCDWLSNKWNHARWLYTAITRAKKRVELKKSNYFQLIDI